MIVLNLELNNLFGFEDLQKEFAKYVKDKKYLKWVGKSELHWKYLVQD